MKNAGNENDNGRKLPLVEEFFTLQGEGFQTGRAAYFIRLGGCDVGCSWCDTRFSWNPDIHPLVDADSIVDHVSESGADSVVVTGGEPLIWNLDYLCGKLKKINIRTFIETSGAYPLSGEWNWICLSPKKNMPPVGDICKVADELKVIIQKSGDFTWAELYREKVSDECRLFLQPEWSRYNTIVPEIVEYIKKNPVWRISLQAHKFLHIP
ncbi:MAG TPA: 7-carboxy-7-deazaguanine synthase QueE [Bacteroidales bacterium]|nr:7-carboxy-7-deazaguanine synthase QueE [Bacteroidales bacterium]